jgi:hypothetical protein
MLRRAVLALGVAGLVLTAWLAQGREGGWLLIGFGLLMLWAGWHHGRRGLSWGHLRVDADGAAHWRDLDRQVKGPAEGLANRPASAFAPARGAVPVARSRREPPIPPGPVVVRVERWFAGERLAWLRLRDDEGGRYEILVGRGSIGEERWRQLSAWLAWLRRGAAA